MYRNEKWKDGWLWIQTTPNGRWEAGGFDETFKALAERVAKLEQPAEAVEPAPFELEDFAHTAKMLRHILNYDNRDIFRAACSNKLNIILAALDKASEDLT